MRMLIKPLLATAAAAISALGMAMAQTIAITNAELHLTGPSTSPRTIPSGTVLIEDGLIRAVGPNITVPAGATEIDAGGAPVTPGFFAALSAIGIEELSLNNEGNDRSGGGDLMISASLNAEDALNTDSAIIPISRAGGVTRAYVTPDPGDKLFGGCGLVIDLTGSADPVTERCIAQNVAMGYAGARRTGDTKTGAMAMLRHYLNEVRVYDESPADYRFAQRGTDLTIQDLDALVPYVRGEKPLLVSVASAPDIRRLLQLKEDYGLEIILFGADEAWRVADELAAADVPVIIYPMSNLPGSFETLGSTLSNAARLEEAGVTVAFFDYDIGYTHNVRLLPQLAGNAVANGMTYQGALAAIATNPAIIYGVDDRLGTLQAGKIADVVVWDGDPLEVTSRPSTVIINGEIQSLENRQSILAERYRDLSRGDLPHAYRGN